MALTLYLASFLTFLPSRTAKNLRRRFVLQVQWSPDLTNRSGPSHLFVKSEDFSKKVKKILQIKNWFGKPGWFVKTEFVKSGEHCNNNKKRFAESNEYGSLIDLSLIGANVTQEESLSSEHKASSIFTDDCDQTGNYFITPNNYTGLAFTLDLGAIYNISQFRLRNTNNAGQNDR